VLACPTSQLGGWRVAIRGGLGVGCALAVGLGCQFDQGGLAGDGDPAPDATPRDAGDDPFDGALPIDAPGGDAPATCLPWPWAPTNFDPCDDDLPAPTSSLTLSMGGAAHLYDTDTGQLRFPNGSAVTPPSAVLGIGASSVRVLVLQNVNVMADATLRVQGSRPLIIAAWGNATVSGTVDASGTFDAGTFDTPVPVPGPGADHAICADEGAGEPGDSATGANSGGGGGGGGAHRGDGGDGGDGGSGPGGGRGAKGSKGSKWGPPALSPLRGGCSGGDGGDAAAVNLSTGGAGGPGGGAVQIAARDVLTVSGTVRSVGAGGRGGGSSAVGRAGGGGGGSGGALLLEAGSLTISASGTVCATGGSGGEGSGERSVMNVTVPAPGAHGTGGSCQPGEPATTDDDAPNGGDGGDGGDDDDHDGENGGNGENVSGSGGGGGGGGGGVGRIRLRADGTLSVHGSAVVVPQAQ
jgi:hypothetical protein